MMEKTGAKSAINTNMADQSTEAANPGIETSVRIQSQSSDLLKISVCNRRIDKRYKNQEWAYEDIVNRNRSPIRTSETAQEYPKLPKKERDTLKDQGGFVGGWLTNGIRKNGNVIGRILGTLDADSIKDGEDFLVSVRAALIGVRYFIYSTHSHAANKPRYRIVILLNRTVSEDEYPALMRMVARQIGMDFFDDSTYQANRMMYWASCPSNGEFFFEENGGFDDCFCTPLDVDAYLNMYVNWRDTTQWPTSTRQSQVMKRQLSKQQDPTEKKGIIGAFCRTYTITDAIDTFLSDVYQPSALFSSSTSGTPARYDYIPADSQAGVVIYGDKFAYSHHASDPACDKLLNAFDIVRIHKFSYGPDGSELDDKESFKAMSDFAISDDNVKCLLAEERKRSASEDFAPVEESEGEDANSNSDNSVSKPRSDWRKQLEYEPRTAVLKNTLANLMLIMENDEALKSIRFNLLAGQIYAGSLPWKRPHPSWREQDNAQLIAYVDRTYGSFSTRFFDISLAKVTDDRSYHPIKEYLDTLPEWDNVPRIETLIVDYFGADDNVYTRMATRKLLTAAVARIYQPGIKFDSMLVLNGRTDLGKSTFFARLAGDWFSDSLNFTDMGKGKDAAEKIQGKWMIEIPEMAGLSKMDVNNIKGFLSRQDDQYRASYGKVVESHLRQCVFVGSTNAQSSGFLRDDTGNRRFWVIDVKGTNKRGWNLPKEDVPQIWAEAKHYWEQGEELYLSGEADRLAKLAQIGALESDPREGLVREYLDILLPDNWYEMEVYDRRNYILSEDDPNRKGAHLKRKTVSNIEIWTECFGNDRAKMDKQVDSQKIKLIMQKIGGWEYLGKKKRIKGYGPQYYWVRLENTDAGDYGSSEADDADAVGGGSTGDNVGAAGNT